MLLDIDYHRQRGQDSQPGDYCRALPRSRGRVVRVRSGDRLDGRWQGKENRKHSAAGPAGRRARDPRGDRPWRHGRRLTRSAPPAWPHRGVEDAPRRQALRRPTTCRVSRARRAIAQLSHPNIVAVHEVGEHDGLPFFSMESLSRRRTRPLSGGHTCCSCRGKRRDWCRH